MRCAIMVEFPEDYADFVVRITAYDIETVGQEGNPVSSDRHLANRVVLNCTDPNDAIDHILGVLKAPRNRSLSE